MAKYIEIIGSRQWVNDNDNISYNDCDNDDDDDNVEGIYVVHCTLRWLPKQSRKKHLPGRLPHK